MRRGRWWLWLLLALSGCLSAMETERLQLISLCTDICKQTVDEAIYAEGTSIVASTSNLRCRCYFRKESIVAEPEPTPTPRPKLRREQ